MNSSLIYFLVQMGYGISLAGVIFKSSVRMRVALLVSSLLFLVYGFIAAGGPLWYPILWNTAFVLAHTYHLAFRFGSGDGSLLNPTAVFLSKTAMTNFPPAELNSLLVLAEESEMSAGKTMIQAGQSLKYLFCLLQGSVEVKKGKKRITVLKAGHFVGEMSLLTKSNTRADVVTLDDVRFLVWKHADINQWIEKKPERLSYLQSALGAQVVEELLRQNQEMEEAMGESA